MTAQPFPTKISDQCPTVSDGGARHWLARAVVAGVALVVGLGAAVPALSVEPDVAAWLPEALLTPAVADPDFGRDVAVDGDVAVVSNSSRLFGGVDSGVVRVFRHDDGWWNEEATLIPADGTPDDEFGISVAVSGDTIVVGSRGADGVVADTGAAYVFTRLDDDWVEQAKLVAPDGAENDSFGADVAVSGDVIAVGASGTDTAAFLAGAVHIFGLDAEEWAHVEELTVPIFGLQLGYAVDVSDGVVVAGSPGQSEPLVIVFRSHPGGWFIEAVLVPPDPVGLVRFGRAVAVSGDTMVVGDYGDSSHGDFTGAAYVFGYEGGIWSMRAKLAASDSSGGQAFGIAVDVDGDDVAIGAPVGLGSGRVYMFERSDDGWIERQRLGTDVATGSMGYSVAVDDDALVVGGFSLEAALVFRDRALTDPQDVVVLMRSTVDGQVAAGTTTTQLSIDLHAIVDRVDHLLTVDASADACRWVDRFELSVDRGRRKGVVSDASARDLIALSDLLAGLMSCSDQ